MSIPIHSIHFISSSSTWHSWRCNDVTFLERFPVILVQYLKHAFHCKIQQMWGEFLLHRYTDVWSSYTNYFTKSSSVLCASLLADVFLYFDVARVMQKPIKPNNTNNLTLNFIDNNPTFANLIPFIYPSMNLG